MKISSDGIFEVSLSTVVVSILSIELLRLEPNGFQIWITAILVIYAIALKTGLAIHSLWFKNEKFTGKPLFGKKIEFGFEDIEAFSTENLSQPPRAKIVLRSGQKLLIKKPSWLRADGKSEFESSIRNHKLEASSNL